MVSEGVEIKGNIICRTLYIAGSVTGDIESTDKSRIEVGSKLLVKSKEKPLL